MFLRSNSRQFMRPMPSVLSGMVALSLILHAAPAPATHQDLTSLSIEDLMEVEIISVSKRTEPLSKAATAVYVITNEDIRRSGATSIPEALRLVPGLHVARIDASRWAITARGFNLQFANKLLVLIDGRTVYTHLFSGVFWDVQDVVLEDVERIEVVRGPGGTLWGANAVNGVINIITKKAEDTRGWLASGGVGSIERASSTLRYGAALGDNAHVRGYVKYFDHDNFETESGSDANDEWGMMRGGFRMDWSPSSSDAVTLQGDYYDGESDSMLQAMIPSTDDLSGGNVLARWQHMFSDTSDFSLQFYYDRTERVIDLIAGEDRDTVDVELEHRFRVAASHDIIVGAGYRLLNDSLENGPAVTFTPERRTDDLLSAFVQDQIGLLDDRLRLILGSKFEHNDYSGFEFQPNLRALWSPAPRHSLWAAVSRAVRTPARVDHDVSFLAVGGDELPLSLFEGNRSFGSEDLLAYEIGYRTQPWVRFSLDMAGYYHDYGELRTMEFDSVPLPTPPYPPGTVRAVLDNKADAVAYGIEVSANWKVTDFWALSGWYTLMEIDLDLDADSTDILTENQDGDTPTNQIQLRSRLDLPWNLEFDTLVHYVDSLPNQDTDSYTRLDLRLGWRPTENLEVSVAGQNLIDDRHEETGSGYFTVRSSVPRSLYGKITLRY